MWMAFGTRRISAIVTAILIVTGLSACVSSHETGDDQLDSRLAGPCTRVIGHWAADVALLQDAVGAELTPRDDEADGRGEFLLSIQHCGSADSRARRGRLSFAYLMVPVSPDSVPLVVTSIPPDGWYAVVKVMADGNSRELFEQLGYNVAEADVDITASVAGDDTHLEAKLQFGGGQFTIAGSTTAGSAPLDTSMALVVDGPEHASVFFGKESAKRYSVTAASAKLSGDTPLSDFDLSPAPHATSYDVDLAGDRLFWRVPKTQ